MWNAVCHSFQRTGTNLVRQLSLVRGTGWMAYLYVNRVAQNAVLASNTVSLIFHRGPNKASYPRLLTLSAQRPLQ